MERKAFFGLGVVMVILTLGIFLGVYFLFGATDLVEKKTPAGTIPDDFEPFKDQKIREKVEIQAVESSVAGMVTQALYTIDVTSSGKVFSLMEALRLHAYCDVGGHESVHMCSNAPGKEEIKTAVREGMDAITETKEDDSAPYRVKAEYRDSTILEVGDDGSGSSFVFLGPLPGGEHVRLTVSIARGELSTGVVE